MWNTPGRRWEKPLDNLMAMSGLGGWDSGGRPVDVFGKYHWILEQVSSNYFSFLIALHVILF